MAACKGFPAKQIVRAQGFRRDQALLQVLERYQFELSDQLHWSQRAVSEPLPEWALAKLASIRATGIRFTTGQAYAERHPNWEAALWRLHAASARDIPSALAKHELTLEQWRTFWQSPENDRARRSSPSMTINPSRCSAWASRRTRQAISTIQALRPPIAGGVCPLHPRQLFEMPESSDVRYISTQNHQNTRCSSSMKSLASNAWTASSNTRGHRRICLRSQVADRSWSHSSRSLELRFARSRPASAIGT